MLELITAFVPMYDSMFTKQKQSYFVIEFKRQLPVVTLKKFCSNVFM